MMNFSLKSNSIGVRGFRIFGKCHDASECDEIPIRWGFEWSSGSINKTSRHIQFRHGEHCPWWIKWRKIQVSLNTNEKPIQFIAFQIYMYHEQNECTANKYEALFGLTMNLWKTDKIDALQHWSLHLKINIQSTCTIHIHIHRVFAFDCISTDYRLFLHKFPRVDAHRCFSFFFHWAHSPRFLLYICFVSFRAHWMMLLLLIFLFCKLFLWFVFVVRKCRHTIASKWDDNRIWTKIITIHRYGWMKQWPDWITIPTKQRAFQKLTF